MNSVLTTLINHTQLDTFLFQQSFSRRKMALLAVSYNGLCLTNVFAVHASLRRVCSQQRGRTEW